MHNCSVSSRGSLEHFRPATSCLPPPPRICWGTLLALFGWSHYAPGARVTKKEVMAPWQPACSRPLGANCLCFCKVAMWPMSACQQAVTPCFIWNGDLGDRRPLALAASSLFLLNPDGRQLPLGVAVYLLAMFWLFPHVTPSFSLHQQPMRTYFPCHRQHWWPKTHLLRRLQVRPFLLVLCLWMGQRWHGHMPFIAQQAPRLIHTTVSGLPWSLSWDLIAPNHYLCRRLLTQANLRPQALGVEN